MSNETRSLSINALRLLGVLCYGAIGIALISQYVYDMQPCAWCVFQRLLYLIIGSVAIMTTLGKPSRLRFILGTVAVVVGAIAGMTSAVYQERVAANTFSCAQTFADQVMTRTGLESVAPWLFGIYASCMDARVKLLGIEYAWWSFAMFTLVGALAAYLLWNLTRKTSSDL